MKKIVFFNLYDSHGSSSKYRTLIYNDLFTQKFDVKYSYFFPNIYIDKYMLNKKRYIIQIFILYIIGFLKRFYQILVQSSDIVVFQRSIFPKMPIFLISYLKRKGQKVYLDVDDAIYLNNRDYSKKIAKQANGVIVGNKNLSDFYSMYNKNVIIIPTIDSNPLYLENRKDTIKNRCIGWIGSFSTLSNLDIIVKCVNRLVDEDQTVSFKIISDSPEKYINKIKNCVFEQWTEENYIKSLSTISIGIMPLFDTEFNRGKCGFKIIQYLNLYKPAVASPVGVNTEILKDNNYGFLATTEEEWYFYLKKLLYDEQVYNKTVKYIEENFEKDFGIYNNYKRLRDFIIC